MNDRFIESIWIDWDEVPERSYLRNIEALKFEGRLSFDKGITFFVGENGTGKSTLLEAIAAAYGFNPEGGTRNYSFSTYDSHSDLYNALYMAKGAKKPEFGYFLRAESFYNVATKEAEYSSYGGNPLHLHEKSHGESFMALIQNTFKDKGIYILDEPEAALSPQRQLLLLLEMKRLVERGSQFIVASHSPILLGIPDAQIYSFDGGIISECSYEDTESYRVTELFINDREGLLKRLFD